MKTYQSKILGQVTIPEKENPKEPITVSIRAMDPDLWWEAKTLASSRQMTIRELIINLLKKAIKDDND